MNVRKLKILEINSRNMKLQLRVDDKILDSFDIVTIVAEIDSEYDVAIPAEELLPENFNSAKALYALVERLMEE